jgi:hypothetical protein
MLMAEYTMRLPKARTHKLTIRELPDETLVYDHLTAKAHCLNHTAGLVWKHCDGKTTGRELAGHLDIPEPVVRLALEQLERRQLLQGSGEKLPEATHRSRRDLLKKLAGTAALPLIMTMTAPRATAAASVAVAQCQADSDCQSLTTNSGCTMGKCQSGKCVAANLPNDSTTATCNGSVGCTNAPCGCLSGKCTTICFPADTPVTTPAGLRSIQSIRAGDQVWGFCLATREWLVRGVLDTSAYIYDGDLAALTISGTVVEATVSHPFWVVQGEGLDGRGQLQPLAETAPDAPTPGRWVDAGNLRVGDVVLLTSGRLVSVDRLVVRPVRQPVYNFQVEGVHTYTVGACQVLVHNGC